MDSLANYGSDDDYEETSSEKMGTSVPVEMRTHTPQADANYEEVQMDLSSEESNNNNSAEDEEQQRVEKPTDKRRHNRSRSRDDPRAKPSDSRSNRHRRDRSEDRDSHRKEEDRDRSRKYESKASVSDDRYERSKYSSREDKSSKSRDDKRKHRRSGSKERKRSSSRDRNKRSNSKERDRRRSVSKERRRSRSPRRTEYRRRSASKEREIRPTGSRYGKRFDRTSNKMAQLEKLGIEIKTPDAEFVTPQMLLQRSMDEQVQKVKNTTGIELPKYYNPAAMNPARYADQIQKRRLLWQKKEVPQETVNKPMGKVWEQTTFAQDTDGKVASKFKRLMGIKDAAASSKEGSKDILKKQEEMFSSMEAQYEVARTATHTMRGVGLGFGSYANYPR